MVTNKEFTIWIKNEIRWIKESINLKTGQQKFHIQKKRGKIVLGTYRTLLMDSIYEVLKGDKYGWKKLLSKCPETFQNGKLELNNEKYYLTILRN